MQTTQTEFFERDVKKLGNDLKQRIKKSIQKISDNPRAGKPLKHFTNVFTERIENYRLTYRLQEDEILLVCFKNRDEVYEFIKTL